MIEENKTKPRSTQHPEGKKKKRIILKQNLQNNSIIWYFLVKGLWVGLHFGSKKRKNVYLDKSSINIDILSVFFEPKWSPSWAKSNCQGVVKAKRAQTWPSRIPRTAAPATRSATVA